MSEKRSNFEWILAELPRLHADGMIPEDVKSTLENHYRSKLESFSSPLKIFTLVISATGAVLVAAGLILFLDYNWDMFPKAVRISLAFVPLILAAAVSYFTLAKEKSQLFRESSAILTAGGTAAVIAMLSQIYHINGELRDYFTLVLLLSAPLLYIFNSAGTALLYVFFSFFLIDFNSCSWQLLVIQLLFLPFLLRHLRQDCSSRVWFRYLAGGAALSGFIGCSGVYYTPLPLVTLCGIFIISGCDLLRRKAEFLKNPWLWCGFAAQTLLLAIGSSDDHIFRIKHSMPPQEQFVFWTFNGILILIFLFVFLKHKLTLDRILELLLILLTVIPFFTGEPVMRVVFNCYFGLAGIAWMRSGFVKRQPVIFNLGALLLMILAACRFFDQDIGVLYRSAGFVLLGLGFITANAIYLKRRAK